MTTTPTPPAERATLRRALLALVASSLLLPLPQCKGDEPPPPADDTSTTADPVVAQQHFAIRVRWPGANAADVDELVAKPIIASLQGFERIDRIEVTSRDSEALAVVTLSKEIRDPEVEVTRDGALRRVATRLPAEAEIVALRGDPTAPPDQLLVLTSKQLPVDELGRLAGKLETKLEALEGVTRVDLLGAAAHGGAEVTVTLDPKALAATGMTAQSVVAAIQHPREAPKDGARGSGLDALGAAVIGDQDPPMRLRDLATIRLGRRAGAGVLRLDGEPAVGLAVHGAGVTHEAAVAAIAPELPPTVKLGWTSGKAAKGTTGGLHVSMRLRGDQHDGSIDEVLDRVEQAALRLPGGEAALAWTQGPRAATLLLRGRWSDAAKAADSLRATVAELAGVEARVAPLDARGFSPRPAPVRIEVTAPALGAVEAASEQVRHALTKVEGARSIWSSLSRQTERQVKVDRAKATAAGVAPTALVEAVRLRESGLMVAQVRDGDTMVPVRVVVDGAGEGMTLAGKDGARVPLDSVTRVEVREVPDHIDRVRRAIHVTVSAEVSGRDVDDVRADVTAALSALKLPPGVVAKVVE